MEVVVWMEVVVCFEKAVCVEIVVFVEINAFFETFHFLKVVRIDLQKLSFLIHQFYSLCSSMTWSFSYSLACLPFLQVQWNLKTDHFFFSLFLLMLIHLFSYLMPLHLSKIWLY